MRPRVASLLESQADQRFPSGGPDGTYPVFVEAGILGHIGDWMKEFNSFLNERSARGEAIVPFSSRCALVTNPTVGAIYSDRVMDSLRARGIAPTLVLIPDGEKFKTLDVVGDIYNQFLDAQMDRRSAVLALGGGVIGDMAGFAAATFMRGTPFIQVPTSLLAMVDASIGGKVAVDHARGKNLIGAFKSPHAVFADVDVLSTLPQPEWRSGLAEVIKHAMIADPGLFAQLEQGLVANSDRDKESVVRSIRRAVQVKVDIVVRDPFELGERAILNLGHTFGHALEKVTNYELRHGEAVAIGLICATRLAENRGWCEPGLTARVRSLVQSVGLPDRVPGALPAEAIAAKMQDDKKRIDGQWRLILPRAIGQVEIAGDVGRQEVLAVLEQLR